MFAKYRWTVDGVTARVIAEELGTTRNAILGKAHRQGWKKSPGTLQFDVDQRLKSRERKPPRPPTRVRAVPAAAPVIPPPAPPPAPVAPEQPSAHPVTLMQLKARHCRWPLGDPRKPEFRFCGDARIAASPYCEHHRKLAQGAHVPTGKLFNLSVAQPRMGPPRRINKEAAE